MDNSKTAQDSVQAQSSHIAKSVEAKSLKPASRRRILKGIGVTAAGLAGIGLTADIQTSAASGDFKAFSIVNSVLGTTPTPTPPYIKFNGPVDAPKYMRKGRDLEGTIFPANPDTGDRFFRTDRAIDYYWSGTNWLSVTPFAYPMSYFPSAAFRPLTTNFTNYQIWGNPESSYSIYIESLTLVAFVAATLDVTNNWQYQFSLFSTGPNGTPFGTQGNLYQSGRGPNTHYVDTISINTSYSPTDLKSLALSWTKVGSPGGLSEHPVTVKYRLIG